MHSRDDSRQPAQDLRRRDRHHHRWRLGHRRAPRTLLARGGPESLARHSIRQGTEHMPDQNLTPRPWWVRLFARPGSKRSAVRAGAISGCLLVGVALLICAVGGERDRPGSNQPCRGSCAGTGGGVPGHRRFPGRALGGPQWWVELRGHPQPGPQVSPAILCYWLRGCHCFVAAASTRSLTRNGSKSPRCR